MNDCILIGLDSSTTNTGYSIYTNACLTDYGVISCSDIKDNELRFESMCKRIIELLNHYHPRIISAELTTPTRNAVTQRKLTMLLGVIYGWCIEHDCECIFYRATEWRSLISSHYPKKREELKQWAIQQVNDKYHIQVNDDTAEAILIGQARINEVDQWIERNTSNEGI